MIVNMAFDAFMMASTVGMLWCFEKMIRFPSLDSWRNVKQEINEIYAALIFLGVMTMVLLPSGIGALSYGIYVMLFRIPTLDYAADQLMKADSRD